MSIIRLQSIDGEVFETEERIAKRFGTIKKMIEDCGLEGADGVVPLQNVNSNILRKVIEWATHHQSDPVPTESDENKENQDVQISEWDADFMKVDQRTLYELILAANYLDARALMDLTCKTVADQMKGKSTEVLRKEYFIPNDFSTTELQKTSKDSEWCEEK